MGIEVITRQIEQNNHAGLAAVERTKLIQMRNQGLRDCFKHLADIPHKMEFVAKIQDKRFIDDAASRNVNSTWYAIESTEGPIIWIANGSDSNVSYDKIVKSASQKVKMLICVGDNNSKLHEAFNSVIPNIIDCPTIESAVNKALYNNIEKATVLYSPSVENITSANEDGTNFRKEVGEL